jgi:hypothetical protein
MAIRTIEQKITAGSQFTGAAPAGAAVLNNDMERHPTGVVGGLFNFATTKPVRVEQFSIKFGGQASWTLNLVDVDAVETLLLSGTTEASLVNTSLRPWLLEGQKLKLVTVGATTAMVARISVDTSPN